MAITTGLRLSEQLGLRWADVDFERHCLHVRTTLQRAAGAYSLSDPKSATSRRVVALPRSALEALSQERQRRLEARLAAGGRMVPADPRPGLYHGHRSAPKRPHHHPPIPGCPRVGGPAKAPLARPTGRSRSAGAGRWD